MSLLTGIEAFVRVAQMSSYSDAAQVLGVSKSVVSQRVQQLEAAAGSPLLLRNTRSVALSEAGQSFFDECVPLVERVDELVSHLRDLSGLPSGTLRVHALSGFALGMFADLLGAFQSRYPGIALDLVTSDTLIDPVREGYDCALQIFEPVSDALVARKLFAWRGVFCASPSYLEACGEPRVPADLAHHRLGLYSRYPTRDRWVFHAGGGREELLLRPGLRSNNVHLLRDFARASHGVVFIPTFIAAGDLLDGHLKAVLTHHHLPTYWLSAVFPFAHRNQLKLRLFLETLGADQPVDEPVWDRALFDRGLLERSPVADAAGPA